MTDTNTVEQGTEKTYDPNNHVTDESKHVDAGENSNGGVDLGEANTDISENNADKSGETVDGEASE